MLKLKQKINRLRLLTPHDIYLGPKKWRTKKRGDAWRFVTDIVRMHGHFELGTRSAALTYYLLFALVPLVIFVLMISTIIGSNLGWDIQALNRISQLVPKPVFQVIETYLPQIDLTPSFWSLIITIFITLWTAAMGFGKIFQAVVTIYPAKKKNLPMPERVAGIIFTIIFMLLLIVTTLLLSFGGVVISFLNTHLKFLVIDDWIINLVIYSFGSAMIMLTFYLLFWAASKRSALNIRALPGAIFSSVGWSAISYLYAFYIARKSNMSSLYGGLVNIIILLIWLNLCCLIILLGALINYRLTWRKLRTDRLDLLADYLYANNNLHYADLRKPQQLSDEQLAVIDDEVAIKEQASVSYRRLPTDK